MANLSIRRHHLSTGMRKAQSLAKRAGKLKEHTEKAVKEVVSAAEIGGSAFALGIAKGRYGVVDVAGVPIDLLTAGALHIGGFLGLAGKQSRHLHALGSGALASYMTTLGQGVGISMKAKALGTAVKGAAGHHLKEAELAALAR